MEEVVSAGASPLYGPGSCEGTGSARLRETCHEAPGSPPPPGSKYDRPELSPEGRRGRAEAASTGTWAVRPRERPGITWDARPLSPHGGGAGFAPCASHQHARASPAPCASHRRACVSPAPCASHRHVCASGGFPRHVLSAHPDLSHSLCRDNLS
ncbi:unnamed protein product [Rangifer tarandus platyrhynchus]|uniref:Uncharacterized protein n=1 Tax=Rangifer tarandus platyrhynchus TaxID=3082113 RepID=A0AC59YS19_RANTA